MPIIVGLLIAIGLDRTCSGTTLSASTAQVSRVAIRPSLD
jgi:hypothetical protein